MQVGFIPARACFRPDRKSRKMTSVRDFARRLLLPLGVAVTRPDTLDGLVHDRWELARMKGFHSFLSTLTPDAMRSALRMVSGSRGENFQDIFAMLVLEERENGFFVEFGATNGVVGSNSYM